MNEAMLEAEAATVARYNRHQERTIRDQGYGSTDGALKITQEFCRELATAIPDYLRSTSQTAVGHLRGFAVVAGKLDPLVTAAAVLQAMLNAVAVGSNVTETILAIGSNVRAECWSAGLLEADGKLHARIVRAARDRAGSVQQRRAMAERMAARAGYRGRDWSRKAIAQAGGVLLDCALDALPELFHVEDVTYRSVVEGKVVFESAKYLAIWPTALAMAEAAVEDALRHSPVFVPCRKSPEPWRSINAGGYWDERERLSARLVRTASKASLAGVRSAFNSGSLTSHVSAVNALQAVPWRINSEVLSLVQWADQWVRGDDERRIKGIVESTMEELPRLAAEEWQALEDDARKHRIYEAGKRRQHNRAVVGGRVQFAQDIEQAKALLGAERFYTPINCDWRGRVYPIPGFNFQRNDVVRSLFQFADGVPLGDDGLYWLKIHVANSGGFNKVDKAPFAERIAWVDQNIERIKALAWDPKGQVQWWMQADAPFLFVAACLELTAALAAGPTFATKLPVSFDGSCSGLQHLCAMTRAPEGSLVNLTPSDRPQDVYQTVADLVQTRVTADYDRWSVGKTGDAPDVGVLAKLCLDYGIDRKLVKRNVMTFAYSSKVHGMRDQLIEDTMEKLELRVLKKELPRHPFGDDNGKAAAKYLAQHTYAAIAETVALPAAAMGFLQQCARALAHEGKPLTWTTPTGLPWANRYHKPTTENVYLHLYDRPVRLRLATGDAPEIWKSKASDAVAPNFVHACDASHLLRTVNACVAEGITSIATVHDSFGCHAPHARRFNAIIREEFVRMYEEHDVLAEVLASAKRDLTDHNWHRLPETPTYGNLQLKEVLNAEYAFA
jgi:DNA-directed RNA polymerase